MCIAVGNVSFELWDILTWSFGCIAFSFVKSRPIFCIALWAMTSFIFIFVCVPLPVCQIESGNAPSSLPSIISSQAFTIASFFASSILPSSWFVRAKAFLRTANALISSKGIFSVPILKFSRLLWVWAPHIASIGTRTSPIVSFSILYSTLKPFKKIISI